MIILVGASASGKTEIAKKIISLYGFKKVVTYTTRPKRDNEKNGIDYHFISLKSFEAKKKKNFFLETTLYNGNYYGTSYESLGLDTVLIVDPKGLKAYRELHNDTIISFYILVSKKNREIRMNLRGDPQENIEQRLKNDDIDFSYSHIGDVDFVIEGDTAPIIELAEEIYQKYSNKLKH